MSPAAEPDAYDGPATLDVGGESVAVQVRLRCRFEPTDGRTYWGGRVRPDETVVELQRAGVRAATIRIGQRTPGSARLGDIDPWGGIRIQGTGRPPWTPAQEAS